MCSSLPLAVRRDSPSLSDPKPKTECGPSLVGNAARKRAPYAGVLSFGDRTVPGKGTSRGLAEHWDVLQNEVPVTKAVGGISMFNPEEGERRHD